MDCFRKRDKENMTLPENNGQKFNLETHLLETADKYCEGMSDEQKKKLFSRITCDMGNKGINSQKIYNLDELSPKNFPTDNKIKEMENADKRPLLPTENQLHQEAVKKVKALIKDFTANNSLVSKDLAKLLDENNTELTIRIKKWGTINASVALKKKEKEGEKNKMIIFVSDEMFKKQPFHEALPGLLAHEFGHPLEFQRRPKGHETEYMDGCETTADIIGTQLAVNAGYDSRAFGKFMSKDFENTGLIYDCTPTGDFRGNTIDSAYHEMTQIKQERTKGKNKLHKNRITAQKLRELQGIASPPASYKTPSRPQNINQNASNLEFIQNLVHLR